MSIMQIYFHIKYEFSPPSVMTAIDGQLNAGGPAYICVADGNILQMVHRDEGYRKIVNGSMFSICDSSWVPLFLKWKYGLKVPQYCGSQIFHDILSKKCYRMAFLGTSDEVLVPLKKRLASLYDSRIASMLFVELPFCEVDGFDYAAIAKALNEDAPQIIWIALGAPKQERFMARLKPFLNEGVMIGVGAVFKFYSGVSEKRAPRWMVKCHLEFLYRVMKEPRKQVRRCWNILMALPSILSERDSR